MDNSQDSKSVLSDDEIARCEQDASHSPNMDAFARAIEAAVLAKQAPTGQSGEVEGLLKEVDAAVTQLIEETARPVNPRGLDVDVVYRWGLKCATFASQQSRLIQHLAAALRATQADIRARDMALCDSLGMDTVDFMEALNVIDGMRDRLRAQGAGEPVAWRVHKQGPHTPITLVKTFDSESDANEKAAAYIRDGMSAWVSPLYTGTASQPPSGQEPVANTPDATLPPLSQGPRRKMLVEIEVGEDFEHRLDNQWEVEREIHADRWSWSWK